MTTTNTDRLATLVALLAALSLVAACGGSKGATKGDGAPGTSGAAATGGSGSAGAGTTAAGPDGGTAAKPQSATATEARKLTDEDFKVRVVEAVEAPDYLPGVDHKAQDEFRVGVKASLASPPRYALAEAQFRTAAELDPGFMEAYFNLGMSLERLGKRDKALEVYQQALRKNPDNVTAQAYVAKIYLGKGKRAELVGDTAEASRWYGEAKQLLDPLVSKEAENVAVNNAMALYHLAKGDLDTAERYVKEVLYVEPTDVTGLNTRGLINLRRGKFMIAEWIFKNKVLAEDPNSTEALTNLGYTYVQIGKRPLAMKYFRQALEQDPENMEVRMNIAAMLLEHLNYAEAHGHYDAVVKAQPLNLEAHLGLCDATFGLGGSQPSQEAQQAQFKTAIGCYVDYLQKRPDRTDLYRQIAETYQQKLQDLENAVKYYELYVAKAGLSPEEKTKIDGTVKVLKDIIAKGGLKAMMEQPMDDGDDMDGDDMDGTEGDGTEGDGTEGDGTEGDGTEGDGTEGDGTEGDGTEGDGTEGDGTEDDGTEDDGTEGDAAEETPAEGDGE